MEWEYSETFFVFTWKHRQAFGFHGDSLGQLIGMVKRAGETYQIEDRRQTLPNVDFTFTGQLRPFQEEAVKADARPGLRHSFAATGSGKTVVACYMIAQRKQPALIIVHTRELLEQWVDRIGQFLGIPPEKVGQIGHGERTVMGIGSRSRLFKVFINARQQWPQNWLSDR